MQDVWTGFVVFTLRDQPEIVVAVKGKALHVYQTRSSYGLRGNQDGFVKELWRQSNTGKKEPFQNI